jgi:hypothetical protein
MSQQQLSSGAEVKVARPGPGERGAWRVVTQARSKDPADPAWEVTNVLTGRTRFFHQSRLHLVKQGGKQ